MKKVLLLGAISPFCDLVNEINDLNVAPIVCDYYADAPAKKMGCLSYDVSTMDIERLNEVAEENEIDGVVSAFSDRNLIPALEICTRRKLNYFFSQEIIECLTDKKEMKSFFQSYNIPVVKYGIHSIRNLTDTLSEYEFPVVTKPIDAYGSKGIFVCQNQNDIVQVANRTLKESLKYSDKIIIEEFYQADEISISAWVKGGKAYITCIYDVFRNFENDIMLSAVSFPSKYTEKHLDKFDLLINKVIENIGISEGPITLQCFIGNKGIKISELLCRLAGGSPYLYPTYMGGPNLAKMMIQNAIGEKVDYQNLGEFIPLGIQNEVFYDIQIMVRHKGVISYNLDIEYIRKQIKEIVDFRIYYPNGSELINVGNSGVQFAKVICKMCRSNDYYTLIEKIDHIVNVFDECGSKVSFIRKPERLDITDTYNIDWSFMEN